VIAAHFTWSPRIQQLIRGEKIEAYCFPGGVVQQLLREIGAGRPGLFTHSGLGTFVDPRHDGGRCNQRSREELVELMHVDGHEILRYKPFKVDVAIIRGTYADSRANISPEEEPSTWIFRRSHWLRTTAAAGFSRKYGKLSNLAR
jgi:propionate CoA-transferase